MKPIMHWALIAGLLLPPTLSRAQAAQPLVREIATIPGAAIDHALWMPNQRVLLYTVGDSVVAYDLAKKRSTLVVRGFDDDLTINQAGDRIAFYRGRAADDPGIGFGFIWSMRINSVTGAADGVPQRVSVSTGDCPGISPTGNLIAFARDRNGNNDIQDLAVVDASGGPERIIAEYGKPICYTSWSADEKWIYVRRYDGPEGIREVSIHRVPVAGGRSESLFTGLPYINGRIDDQLAFYRPLTQPAARAYQQGRVAYVSSSGARGEFRIPPGADLKPMRVRSLMSITTRPATTHILALSDDKSRDLLPGAMNSRGPVWSPDGRRIALQNSTGGSSQITVMNSDGSLPRRYPVAWDPTSWGFMQWASSGQKLAYYADVGGSAVGVLDLATGSTRIVSSSPNGTATAFTWRPDGNSLVVLKQTAAGKLALYETRLDGAERLLRDLGTEYPTATNVGAGANVVPRAFVSDRLLIMGSASHQSVIPTDGGPAQNLPPGANLRFTRPGVSPSNPRDAKWILWLVQNPGRPITSVDIMTVRGDSLRTLNLPFEVNPGVFHDSFRAGERHIVLVGKTPGESVSKIFLVPVNGDAPRTLTQFSGRLIDRFDLSPDGKSLVYTVEGPPTTTIYELDMSPILQALRIR